MNTPEDCFALTPRGAKTPVRDHREKPSERHGGHQDSPRRPPQFGGSGLALVGSEHPGDVVDFDILADHRPQLAGQVVGRGHETAEKDRAVRVTSNYRTRRVVCANLSSPPSASWSPRSAKARSRRRPRVSGVSLGLASAPGVASTATSVLKTRGAQHPMPADQGHWPRPTDRA
jgi:hypothetical protein